MSKEQIEKSFKVAESFHKCGHILSSKINAEPSFTGPWIVNIAFSIETYLKCLHLIESGVVKKIHPLLDLYETLSLNSRNIIKALYTKEFLASPSKKHWDWFVSQGAPIPDFTQITIALKHASNAFVNWRVSVQLVKNLD